MISLNTPVTLGPFTDANGQQYTITISQVNSQIFLETDFSLTGSDESWIFW